MTTLDEQVRSSALHEAGHVVAALAKGFLVTSAWIVRDPSLRGAEHTGRTEWWPPHSKHAGDVLALAGDAAVVRGWLNAERQGSYPGVTHLEALWDEGRPQEDIQALFEEALAIVDLHWSSVEAITERLIGHDLTDLTREDLEDAPDEAAIEYGATTLLRWHDPARDVVVSIRVPI